MMKTLDDSRGYGYQRLNHKEFTVACFVIKGDVWNFTLAKIRQSRPILLRGKFNHINAKINAGSNGLCEQHQRNKNRLFISHGSIKIERATAQ
jgi:hypothetical protein